MHAKLTEDLNKEIGRRNALPAEPNPRYTICFTATHFNGPFPDFTLEYQADSPSAAIQIAHRFTDMLGIPCDWHDKHTGRTLFMSHLQMDEE